MLNNNDFASMLSKAGAGRSSSQVKDVNEALTSWAKGKGGKKKGRPGDYDEDDEEVDDDDDEEEEGKGTKGAPAEEDSNKVIWKKGKKVAR